MIIEKTTNFSGNRHIVEYHLKNAETASYLEAAYFTSVREINRFADLYSKGNILILDTSDEDLTNHINTFLTDELTNKYKNI